MSCSTIHCRNRLAEELRAVVGAQEHRRAAFADKAAEDLNDAPGVAARHIDRQALSGELVDDSEALELLANDPSSWTNRHGGEPFSQVIRGTRNPGRSLGSLNLSGLVLIPCHFSARQGMTRVLKGT